MGGGFWGIWRKLVELRTGHRTRRVDFRLLAEALGRCRTRWVGGRWKSQNRKNVYLSPYVEEPLNSNVIKSFVPELRSRCVFFEFRDSYEHSMYISYIAISWLWYIYIYIYIILIIVLIRSKVLAITQIVPLEKLSPNIKIVK